MQNSRDRRSKLRVSWAELDGGRGKGGGNLFELT